MKKVFPTQRNEQGQPMAACVLVCTDDGMVLAVSRKNDPYDFGLPGGKVDQGESPKEAAARELAEETGLVATRLRQVFKEFDGSYCCYTFVGDVSGSINTDEEGVVRWVHPDVLLSSSRFAPYNRKLFKHVGIKLDRDQTKEGVVKITVSKLKALIKEETTRAPLTAYGALELVHRDNGYLSKPSRLIELFERLEKEQFSAGYEAGYEAALRGDEDA